MISRVYILLGWVFLLSARPALAQGYSVEGDRIVVEGEDQWKEWSYPKSTLAFEEDGSFHPIYIQKNINACLNAHTFRHGEGIWGGGDAESNPEDAPNLLDGDVTTYWEPDRDDPLKDWWVEIDLGRVLCAKKVVLRFAEDADPFLGFKVLTWGGEWTGGVWDWDTESWVPTQKENWREIGRTINTGLDERTFEFDIPLSLSEQYTWSQSYFDGQLRWLGRDVQYIRLFVMSTRGDSAEEVSKEMYDTLDPDLRGAVMYYRITPSGEEEWLDREGYEKLSAEERGPIRYYRREVPRLAEVEVWAYGDNVCLGAVDRGGSVDYHSMIDGAYRTGAAPSMVADVVVAQTQVDLGASFWLDSVNMIWVMFSRKSWFSNIQEIRISGSEGAKAADGSLIWEDVILNSTAKHRMRFVRFEFLKDISHTSRSWPEIMELQLYGEGYLPEVEMVSPVIEAGKQRNLTSLRWNAEIASGTNVEIRTRTGNTLSEEIHYFDKGGREVTGHEYHKLPFFRQGERVTERVPGDDWSMWTYPYAYPEDRISSPNPRTYLQIQARLLSDDPEAYADLRSLQIQFFSPLAQQVMGEVHPTRAEREGKLQDFSFYLYSSFNPSNTGFDEILFYSPSRVEIHFASLHVGTEEEYAEGREDIFTSEELDIRSTKSDSVWIHLPYPIRPGGEALIRMDFSSIIHLNGTVFEANVMHSSAPDTPQRVDEGDATGRVSSEEMTVFVPVESRVIGDVEISPDPFTPNGDGINDEVHIGFSVFKVYASVPVWVDIWDLDGRRVRRIEHQREVSSGRYNIEWDGRDEMGKRVSPGAYVARIEVEDASVEAVEDVVVLRTVNVVY